MKMTEILIFLLIFVAVFFLTKYILQKIDTEKIKNSFFTKTVMIYINKPKNAQEITFSALTRIKKETDLTDNEIKTALEKQYYDVIEENQRQKTLLIQHGKYDIYIVIKK